MLLGIVEVAARYTVFNITPGQSFWMSMSRVRRCSCGMRPRQWWGVERVLLDRGNMGTTSNWQSDASGQMPVRRRSVTSVALRLRGVGELQSRQRAFPLLLVTMLLSIAAIVRAAYFGARARATNTAQ